MRTLSAIKESLVSMLQESPTWRRLLRGLIGQELASWGADTAFLNDVSYDSMVRDIHPSSASDLGLSILSASYQIPFQNFAPGYILYKYEGSDALKPYALSFAASGTTWFNIDPVLSGDVTPQIVKLYQGTPTGVVSLSGAFQAVFPNITNVTEVLNSDIYLDQDNVFFYVRLRGENIIPSSIRVHRLTVAGTVPATTYKASMMTSEEMSSATYFSVYSLPDGGQAVRFHDAIPDLFQVTYMTADLSLPDGVSGVGEPPLVSMYNPSTTNLMKRSGFMASMVKDSALSTPEQIKQFCRAAGTLDAVAQRYTVSSGLVSVAVYFIPADDSYDEISFFTGSLSEALSLYGSIATTFNVGAGTSVKFQVQATSVAQSFDKSSFEDLVRGYFATIAPMSFRTALTESLLVYASDNGFSGVLFTYLLTLPQARASMLPRFNSVFLQHKFYKDDELVAWSFGTNILGFSEETQAFDPSDLYFVMSDSVLVKGVNYAYIFDKVTGVGSMINSVDLSGYNVISVGDDMMLLESLDPSSNADLIYIVSFTPLSQAHAISTGVLPAMTSFPVGSANKGSARVFDNGFFSCGVGADTQLFRTSSGTTLQLGLVPNLLFVYNFGFYFQGGSDSQLTRSLTVVNDPAFTPSPVSVAITGTLDISLHELFGAGNSKLRFKGNIMTATRQSDQKTFMFTLTQDSYSLAVASFPTPISAGFANAFEITDTPAAWGVTSPQWFDMVNNTWVDFEPIRFSQIVGSILSGGAPLFTNPLDYDYLTVETSSVSPFASFMEAIYFRLDQTTPVVYK